MKCIATGVAQFAQAAACIFLLLVIARDGMAGANERAASFEDDYCRASPGVELITREDIRNAGLVRLSEIFRLSDYWYAYSIDGYTWEAQVAGLSAASQARWTFLIDDKPIQLGLFGIQSLDVAPIHMNEIDCVELSFTPDVMGGALRPFGTIHVRTQRPRLGMTVSAGASAGNEINDPGPFRYTPLETPNVDRIGPVATGRIELQTGGRYARLSGKLDEFHTTDLQIEPRRRKLYDIDPKPRIYAEAAALTAGLDGSLGSHSLLAGHNSTKDFIFHPTIGVEVPTARRFNLVGSEGTFRIGSAELRYLGSYVSHALLQRPNAAHLEFDFELRTYSGALSSRIRHGPLGVSAGWSINVTDVRTNQVIADTKTMLTRTFGAASVDLGHTVRAAIHGEWVQADDRAAYAFLQRSSVIPRRGHRVDLTTTLSRRTPSMDESLWRWLYAGYALPAVPAHEEYPAPGAVVEQVTTLSEPRLATVDLSYTGHLQEIMWYSVTGYFRSALSEYLPVYDLTFSEESAGLRGHSHLRSFLSGRYVGIAASVRVHLFRKLVQRLTYVAEGAAAGDEAFRDIHARIPAQRLSYTLTYSPVSRFSLYARVRYQAGSVWQDYHHVASLSDGFYAAELPRVLLVDLAATKRLWKDHILANVSLRNIMNEPHRMHPLGAIFDMALHFAVRISFNSEAGF